MSKKVKEGGDAAAEDVEIDEKEDKEGQDQGRGTDGVEKYGITLEARQGVSGYSMIHSQMQMSKDTFCRVSQLSKELGRDWATLMMTAGGRKMRHHERWG